MATSADGALGLFVFGSVTEELENRRFHDHPGRGAMGKADNAEAVVVVGVGRVVVVAVGMTYRHHAPPVKGWNVSTVVP